MDRPIVSFDTERASQRGAPHLLEVGAVRVIQGEIEDHFQRLVRPPVPIEEEAQAIHGIAEADIVDAAEAGDVLTEFLEWVGDDWLIAHNASADAAVIGYELARHGLDAPDNVLLDTLPLARKRMSDAPDHKLSTLAQHLDLDSEGMHRALADATLCAQVLDHCVEDLGGWDEVGPADLMKHCNTAATFASARPAPPRSNTRVRALREAMERGDTAVLLYGGTDRPPSPVEVAPCFLFRHDRKDYLEAIASSSGTLKTYRLDRVRNVRT